MHGRYTLTDATGAVKNVKSIAMPMDELCDCCMMPQLPGISLQQRSDPQQPVDSKTLNSYSCFCSAQVITPQEEHRPHSWDQCETSSCHIQKEAALCSTKIQHIHRYDFVDGGESTFVLQSIEHPGLALCTDKSLDESSTKVAQQHLILFKNTRVLQAWKSL